MSNNYFHYWVDSKKDEEIKKFQECIDILVELESPLADDSSYLSLYAASCRRLGMHKKSELLFKQALKKVLN